MFTQICVGIVILILLFIVTSIIALLLAGKDEECIGTIAWIISTLGFGICLTILLYQNGIIK